MFENFNTHPLPSIKEILDQFPPKFQPLWTVKPDPLEKRPEIDWRHLQYVGSMKVNTHYGSKIDVDPEYMEAVEKGILPDVEEYLPAQLSYPVAIKSLNKYATPNVHVNNEALKIATNIVYEYLRRRMAPCEIWSKHDAWNNVQMGTSAGYPMNYLGYSKDDCWASKTYQEFIDYKWDEMATLNYVPAIWHNMLKDEIRDAERVKQGKTRTFTAMPLYLLINSTRLTNDFNEQFYTLCKTGILPFWPGKDELGDFAAEFDRLSRLPLGLDSDFGSWDARLLAAFLLACYYIRFKLLEPRAQTEANRIRYENLAREYINTHIITQKGDIVRKFLGMCSGGNDTIVSNSLCVLLTFVYLLVLKDPLRLKNKNDYLDVIEEKIEFAIGGDDNAWSFGPELRGFFEKLEHFYKEELNMNFEPSGPIRNPSELTFLSAKVSKETKSAARDSLKLLASLKYSHGRPSPTLMLQKLIAILPRLVHDKPIFDKVYKFRVEFLKKHHFDPDVTFHQLARIPVDYKTCLLAYENARKKSEEERKQLLSELDLRRHLARTTLN